jgi:hypothetical protein
MKYAVAAAMALSPSLALADPGHAAPVFHTHAWETGLAVIAAIVIAGLAIHIFRGQK